MSDTVKDRSYGQFCGLARALDVLGERWTLLVVRELLLGPRRFRELLTSLEGIGPNLLTTRLRTLEARGVVERTRPARAPHDLYRLTARGRALEPALLALASWGSPLLGEPNVDARFDVGWMVLSLKRFYRQPPHAFRVGLALDGRLFTLGLGGNALDVEEREAQRPDVLIEGEGLALAHVLYRGASLDDAIARSALRVEGDTALLLALRRALSVPTASG
ncbi:MAG: helix-turn-helix transcriptional regulator [Sandaracinaceae bacterium]|jgi:DNA-binding HxlR family transcriptional regulator|nr:helix-turn-helix transcriptional regulator [Sandaracinaceae bacterium]MBP7680718.1 helix-turn-helix transcriptional regulator [Deltaproteobacteria bacterium]MBK7150529.1 helix-turn-helix transcriptional regulator [Sandaracinaceae bacterium]MBK7775778.1 helix-turn-helix transcriptional regulator [Sandaracinaceae bacterium]MBK8409334.1 helix-turn-helix transcriptional regulator [Sandaracinaceae bacterium]